MLKLSAVFLCLTTTVSAADWPTRLHDIRRGGVTSEHLGLPLTETWTYETDRAPAPAWSESPAVHDITRQYHNLKRRQAFDRCYDVAIAGGNRNFAHFAHHAQIGISRPE